MPNEVIRRVGDVRTRDGITEIYNGKNWLKYPSTASDLIAIAYAHGWAVSDGLDKIRIREDGAPYIRVLFARPRGRQVFDPDVQCPAYQFHLVWVCNKHSWVLASAYVKSDIDPWRNTVTTTVRKMLVRHARKIPATLVQANN